MKPLTFKLELITPCFCGGAEPDKEAEIRAPSIRGQLRWWFRTLGGFKSLAANDLSLRQQEDLLFGTAAGESGHGGRLTVRVKLNPHSQDPGFRFDLLEKDHDAGRRMHTGPVFRAALGLPIVQKFSSPPTQTVNWEFGAGTQASPKGRFASPVLLRPHRDAQGKWHALVIFVDARQWPAGKKVFLNGQERNVSLDLYEAMKNDPRLKPFPG